MPLSLKDFKKQLNEFSGAGKEPQLIIIGYKTFSNFMKEDKFVDQIAKDQNDPFIRYYKNIKIKVVPEKHYLEFK